MNWHRTDESDSRLVASILASSADSNDKGPSQKGDRNLMMPVKSIYRFAKLSAPVVLALLMLVPAASARTRIIVRGGFGPVWYGYWGPGPYYWGWGPSYVYVPAPYAGTVKINTAMKDAYVYVDGGFAGPVTQMKKFPLRPGTHDIELRSPDGTTLYQETVDVIAGKTVELHADYR